METIRLQEVREPASQCLTSIRFKHPSYQDFNTSNILFSLATYDVKDYEEEAETRTIRGVHYGTAIIACGIVAGNVWDGWLQVSKEGEPLRMQENDILTGDAYFFYHPKEPDYPVVPSFSAWVFPHQDLPPNWKRSPYINRVIHQSASNTAASVIERDRTCCLSGDFDNLNCAHLIPRKEFNWFKENGMRNYNPNQNLMLDGIINDPANALALRQDIHTCFDSSDFAIVPKLGFWVSHFLAPTNNKGNDYHNTKMTLAPEIPGEFLFARFALAILSQIKEFVLYGLERRRVLYRILSGNNKGRNIRMGEYDSETLKEKFYPSPSKQNSPTKRSRMNSQTHSPAVNALPLVDDYCDKERTAMAAIQELKEGTYAWQKLEREAAKRRWEVMDDGCCSDDEQAVNKMVKMQKNVYEWDSEQRQSFLSPE